MKTTLRIDVDKLINLTALEYELAIYDITSSNIQWTNSTATPLTDIELIRDNGHIDATCYFDEDSSQVTLTDIQLAQLYQDDEGEVCIDDHVIVVTGDVDFEHSENLMIMITNGIILFDNPTLIFLYSLNSEKNVVDKTLILRGILTGEFRNQINIKSLSVNIQKIDVVFNYVYIPSLKRYYYVDTVDLLKDLMTLTLSEDVLMSHKDLILSQTAYVTRNEFTYNDYINDNRRVMEEDDIIEYLELDLDNLFQAEGDGGIGYEYKYVLTVFSGN